MKKVTERRLVVMPFYETRQERRDGHLLDSSIFINWGLGVFEVLIKLRNRGVKPGTKLRIVIETVPE